MGSCSLRVGGCNNAVCVPTEWVPVCVPVCVFVCLLVGFLVMGLFVFASALIIVCLLDVCLVDDVGC
jgi:hypothetical protein